MSITGVLRESYEIAKKNPLIFVPLLVASVFSVLFSLITVGSTVPMLSGLAAHPATASPEQMMAGVGAAVGGVFLVSTISGIVYLLAHGMTVALADLAIKDQPASLGAGWGRLMSRLAAIIIASILVGILVGIGTLLLVLPGIIVAFLLMFTLIAVMVDDANAFDALSRSFRTVTRHFRTTFVVFLVLIALGVLSGIVGGIVALIPVLGVILTMVVSALYTGYVTIFMLLAYRRITATPEAAPEPQA